MFDDRPSPPAYLDIMELIFGYLAGLLTLINPCVLPVLPIVLAGALQVDRLGPVVLAAGLSITFLVLGIGVTAFGHLVGLDADMIAQGGAVLMIVFGLMLLVPRFGAVFAGATSGMAAQADETLDQVDRSGLRGQFLSGVLLGAVWSPCVGPTLGSAIALASQGESLGWASLVMLAFVLGVSTIILALGYGVRSVLQRRQAVLREIAVRARPAMGLVFVCVGFALLFRVHHMIEAWALQALPIWLQDLSVSL